MPVNTPKKAAIAARRKVVAVNLLAGLTSAQIAESLGESQRVIQLDIKALMKEWKSERGESTAEYVSLENARLDRLLNSVWPKAIGGDQGAVDRVIKIMDRRAKLLGLDKPTKIEFADLMAQIPDDMLDRYEASGDNSEIKAFLSRQAPETAKGG